MRRRDPDSDMGAFMRNQDLPGGQGELQGLGDVLTRHRAERRR